MKIVICGSMTASREMIGVKNKLVENGHEVVLPEFTEDYAKLQSQDEMHKESAENKVKYDLIKGYYEEIKESDAILIANVERKGIPGYIGGNSFLEMAFAHILNKPIYLLKPIPNMGYTDEMIAMNPIILNENYNLIK